MGGAYAEVLKKAAGGRDSGTRSEHAKRGQDSLSDARRHADAPATE